MAHKIHIDSKNEASFFTVREVAWHGLGKVLQNCPTSEEAIKLAKLDFEVAKAPIFASLKGIELEEARNHNNVIKSNIKTSERVNSETRYFKAAPIPTRVATYRTDTHNIFGVVSDRYEIVQNTQAFDFFDSIVGKGEAIYETAGALGNGEVIFITAKLPDYIRVQEDCINKYLLFTMSHDGTSAIQAMFTPIRVVCNNTLSAALENHTNRISIKHSKKSHDRLKEASKLMGITNLLSDELGQIFNQMSLKSISDEDLQDYIARCVLPSYVYNEKDVVKREEAVTTFARNTMSDMYEYAHVGAGQETKECKGTVYGAYNAITGYYQNVKKYSSEEYKFNSTLLTDIANKRQYAFKTAQKFLTKNY
jgi:phage/plasmid-like protein (TIGR03299 family)